VRIRGGKPTRRAFNTAATSITSCRMAPATGGRRPNAAKTMPPRLRRIPPTALCRAIDRSRRLYDVEAEVKLLDDAGRLAARQSCSRPALDALFDWLEGQRVQVLPKSPMGVAIGYALGNRVALTRYTEAGCLEADNNASERALRAVAVGRRNYLFAGSDSGGGSSASRGRSQGMSMMAGELLQKSRS
jgi:hypothetical protein